MITSGLQLELSSLPDPIVAKPNRRLVLYPSVADSVPSETSCERNPIIVEVKFTKVCTPARVL